MRKAKRDEMKGEFKELNGHETDVVGGFVLFMCGFCLININPGGKVTHLELAMIAQHLHLVLCQGNRHFERVFLFSSCPLAVSMLLFGCIGRKLFEDPYLYQDITSTMLVNVVCASHTLQSNLMCRRSSGSFRDGASKLHRAETDDVGVQW